MTRPAVYTALFGAHDRLVDPVAQDIDVDWICFTDDTTLRSDVWRVVVEPPRLDTSRLAAKWHKAVPHEALPEHRHTIWVDASLRIDSSAFAREALAVLGDAGIAAFAHPQLDCIYEEARASKRLPKYDAAAIDAQVAHYAAEGHPLHWGLWAGGVVARDRDNPAVRELGERWLRECERWTPQDQLSLAFLARVLDVRPRTFPHHLHRHGVVDDLVCRLHRWSWFNRLAERRPHRPAAATPSGSPSPPPVGLRRFVRSNPWFAISPHATDA